MTKNDLTEKIRRRLGYPMVKVELDETQIVDSIDYARDKYIKWAAGNATQEVFFTMALSASQYLYDLPSGVTTVVGYDGIGITSGINTLFTVENFMYSQGMLDSLLNTYGGGYSLVSYHIARDFLDTVRRYSPDIYNFKYHSYSNQIEIQPPPASGGNLTYYPKYKTEEGTEYQGDAITIDSPGWILVRAYIMSGATQSPSWEIDDAYLNFYENDWILDYATAYSKKMLGLIRRKFASFGSMGNQGIALDGGELISEADTEMERLEEKLRTEEVWEGYGIDMA